MVAVGLGDPDGDRSRVRTRRARTARDPGPLGLKVFLLTLAIVDDIGAIIVIAVFYSEGIEEALGWVAPRLVVLFFLMSRLGVRRPLLYVFPALVLWVCTFESGVQPPWRVALGLLTPAGSFRDRRVLEKLERRLHLWTSFLVVPVFALASMGVDVDDRPRSAARHRAPSRGESSGVGRRQDRRYRRRYRDRVATPPGPAPRGCDLPAGRWGGRRRLASDSPSRCSSPTSFGGRASMRRSSRFWPLP